jgi:hypothetical protein
MAWEPAVFTEGAALVAAPPRGRSSRRRGVDFDSRSGQQDACYVRTCFGVKHDEGQIFGSPTPELLYRDVAPV